MNIESQYIQELKLLIVRGRSSEAIRALIDIVADQQIEIETLKDTVKYTESAIENIRSDIRVLNR